MTGKKFFLVAAAVVLALMLLVIIFMVMLLVSMGGSIRGEGYTLQSLLGLVVLMAAAVSLGLLLRCTIRRARQT